MSRAFTKEDDDTEAIAMIGERPISAERNLVTEEGLKQIEAEMGRLRGELMHAEKSQERVAVATILRDLQKDIEAIRYDAGDGQPVELPVKLKVHDSIFTPLAKWAMLLAGNYRCVTKDGPRSIKEAVHSNLAESRDVYDWVRDLCVALGADADDLVPFEKYANAAQGLERPSSAARALFAGAPNIERVDRLVQGIARQKGLNNPVIDATVVLVDARLELNRKKA